MRTSFLLSIVLFSVVVLMVSAKIIPNQYIIQLKPSLGLSGLKMHLLNVTSNSHFNPSNDAILAQWSFDGFTAYSASINSHDLIDYINSLPEVISFENDQFVSLDCTTTPALETGLWGLSRISHKARQTTYTYIYNAEGDGQHVDAYIVDTGILTTHTDFGGRAKIGFNAFPNESPQDLNGHGTHCAGTVAGTKMGIAKKANLISVKVLNAQGSGTNTGIINGIDWIIQNLHVTRPCVINMSLGGGYSAALNTATNRLVAAGCFTSVAAGNSNANSCNYSPASASDVYTVMASTSTDLRASFSNYGSCSKIFAPGQNILSDWIGSNTATNTISGTSMAAPHVAGVAAARLSLNPGNTPQQVAAWMTGAAQRNIIQSPGTGSPNYLLFQGCL